MVKCGQKTSSISLHFEKHKEGVNRVDYKGTTNANPVNDIQTKISKPDRTRKTISFGTTER